MKYDVEWVKGLSESDLVLCNLLSFMRIYHYNLRFDGVEDSVEITHAEAYGIMRVSVKLRTKDNKAFTPSPYYIHEAEAERLIEKLTSYFKEYNERGC